MLPDWVKSILLSYGPAGAGAGTVSMSLLLWEESILGCETIDKVHADTGTRTPIGLSGFVYLFLTFFITI